MRKALSEDSILVIGTSFKTSSLAFRESLARALDAGVASAIHERTLESVSLRTCNRIEFYFLASHPSEFQREFFLNLPHRVAEPQHYYLFRGRRAIEHLFKVTSGLDSMVVGEEQISSQVREAGIAAKRSGRSRAVLATLFDAAVGVGKRVRASDSMPSSSHSVSSFALDLAKEALGRAPKRVLLVGSGKVARLTASQLTGCTIYLVTRNKEVHPHLARTKSITYREISKFARRCDLIISATKRQGYVIRQEHLSDTMDRVILDLAFPRNVDPRLRNSKRVRLFDLDDLARSAEGVKKSLADDEVRLLIDGEVESFRRWLSASRFSPVIPGLYKWAERIRAFETEATLRRFSALSPREREVIEVMGRRLVSKLIAPLSKFAKGSNAAISQEERLVILTEILGEAGAG